MQRPPISLDDTSALRELLTLAPLPPDERHVGLLVMPSGGDRLAWKMIVIDDIPRATPQPERARALNQVWQMLRDAMDDVDTVAIGVCRLGHPAPTGEDLAWHDAVRATVSRAGLRCAGVFLCTPTDALELVPQAA
jgi:hypothetical protein